MTANILPENLREIFKREWDNRYQTTFGVWHDTVQNGKDFLNGESPYNRKKNARLLATMQKGNRNEWDCTMLFYAILYSSSIHGLNPVMRKTVDELREFRNQTFAHKPHGRLKDAEFQSSIQKVVACFQTLGVATNPIHVVSKQISFPTDELQALQQQLEKDPRPFSILPLRPLHPVIARQALTDQVIGCLNKLKNNSVTGLTAVYITGSPGSGKSQLARQIGEKVFKEQQLASAQPGFVMTLEAENQNTLLQSYANFARNLKCPEYSLTSIVSSKAFATKEKIVHLKSLIVTKLTLYSNWLVIIDNIRNLSTMQALWPQIGSEEWGDGQLLITTQDGYVPLTMTNSSVSVADVAISKGMQDQEAIQLLSSLSGLNDGFSTVKVAQALDFQPLALASAAEYVNATFPSKISWEEYLRKLEDGKRKQTEEVLANTNPSYPRSMTAAIEIAVKRAVEEEEIKHVFNFISMFAAEPVPLEVVIQYVLHMNSALDEEITKLKIEKCSLLLLESQPNTPVLIRVHQVVRESLHFIKTETTKSQSEARNITDVTAAIVAIALFTDKNLHNLEGHKDMLYFTICKSLASHLFVLFQNHFDTIKENPTSLLQKLRSPSLVSLATAFGHFGRITSEFGYLLAAARFYELALKISQHSKKVDKAQKISLFLSLGEVSGCLKDLPKSKEYFSQALKCSEQMYGKESAAVAACLENLGNIALKQSQVDDARKLYVRALAINLEHFDEDDVRVASSLQNVGSIQFVLDDFQSSKDCYEKAVKIYEEKYPDGHPSLARVLKNLANAKFHLGELNEAKQLQTCALKMLETFYGSKHLDVAASLDCLGNICRSLGELKEATACHTKSLTIKKILLGVQNLSIASSYTNLGDDAIALEQLEQAEEYFRRALALMTSLLGCDHFEVARCLHKLGALHEEKGELDLAADRIKLALEVYHNCHTGSHEYIVRAKTVLERVSRELAKKNRRS